MFRSVLTALLASLAFAAPASAGGAAADHLYGVTLQAPPHLVGFESSDPGVFTSDRPITGLAVGDSVQGMDTSPRDGGLYLFVRNGADGYIYSLDSTSAA